MEELKKWIKEELTVSPVDDLVNSKDKVKEVLGISSDGKIVFKVNLAKLTARETISLYMIGKVYAKVAGYVDTEAVTNKELIEELKLPEGTIGYTLKELQDERIIVAEKAGIHRILYAKIGRILDTVLEKTGRDVDATKRC